MENKPLSRGDRRKKIKERTFLCRRKFLNDLPEDPCDPKLLYMPINEKSFVVHQSVELGTDTQHFLHTPEDLGLPLNLILDNVILDKRDIRMSDMDSEDLGLLEGDRGDASSEGVREVSWLKKSKILSNETEIMLKSPRKDMDAAGAASNSEAAKLGRMRSSVNDTFMDVPRSADQLVHPSNPSLKPLSVVPFVPDFMRWQNINTVVDISVDSIPVSLSTQSTAKRHSLLKKSFIKETVEEETQQTLLSQYFPKFGEEEVYEAPRDFNYRVISEISDIYALSINSEAAAYSEVLNRIKLSKKQRKSADNTVKKVRIAKRDLLAEEREQADEKMAELLPIEYPEESLES